jgi:hypothetical protein
VSSRIVATGMFAAAAWAACTSTISTPTAPGLGGTMGGPIGGAAAVGAGGQVGAQLAVLSLAEAPAATQTLFWGTVDASAPGFATLPREQVTIGLGADNGLRYMSWQTMPSLPKTYGDGPHDFPLTGTRRVDLNPDYALVFDAVTVLDGPAPTATHFLLRSHYVSVDNQCDYIESIEGTKSGDGWAIVYSEEGSVYAASVSASAQGTVYESDPNATAAPAGQASLWSAPLELTAPNFYGPPIDHLTVSLDAAGQLRWFYFQNFVRKISLMASADELGPNAFTLADQGAVTFDDVVPATPSHFVQRYHVYSDAKLNDYTEGLDGTREGDALVVRYFISGKLWGAAIDAHAAGTLVPASNLPTGGVSGAGGTLGGGGQGGAAIGMGGAGGRTTLP